jgi:ABC-type transporter Mla maintaining outer membrane lipid asymmetry ATPase subunit MlaF
MGRSASFLGNSGYETILLMTDNLTVTDGATNAVIGTSGLSGGKTLTLPSIAVMMQSQNFEIEVFNASGSGGTITIAPNSADSTIIGRVTTAVATGIVFRHDGRHQWYGR